MNRPVWGWAALVFAIIAAVYALDILLARVERAELHNEARGHYLRGEKLLAAGRPADAIEPLQHAYTLERGNRAYSLAYAEALTAARRYDEASVLLNEVIDQAPNDGRANLELARLARAQGDLADEAPYYHRAIYGVWPGDASLHSNQARLEWIEELAARGDRSLLLGELLPLQAAATDPQVLTKVAHYFLDAGSASRSADLYRSLLTAHPEDAGLNKGLGEAQTAAGNYGAAQRAFLRAFRAAPGDASIRRAMELSSALVAIDPTPRRLPSREKYERSARILDLVRTTVSACGISESEADNKQPVSRSDTSNEAAELVLQKAEALWKERPKGCVSPEVLPPLMQKLAQM